MLTEGVARTGDGKLLSKWKSQAATDVMFPELFFPGLSENMLTQASQWDKLINCSRPCCSCGCTIVSVGQKENISAFEGLFVFYSTTVPFPFAMMLSNYMPLYIHAYSISLYIPAFHGSVFPFYKVEKKQCTSDYVCGRYYSHSSLCLRHCWLAPTMAVSSGLTGHRSLLW